MTDNTLAKRKKEKRTNNDLQNTTQFKQTKDQATQTPLKSGKGKHLLLLMCTCCVTLTSYNHIDKERTTL